jgi:Flp pilus assembly protein TadG
MTIRTVIGRLKRFRSAQEASAAVEFALVGPIFATAVVMLADVANILVGVGSMETGMRSAAQYAMNGGSDMGIAASQGLQAWQNRPAGSTITAVKSCICSGAAADCTVPCANATIPETYVTVTAHGTWHGNMISRTQTLSQKVRQR